MGYQKFTIKLRLAKNNLVNMQKYMKVKCIYPFD